MIKEGSTTMWEQFDAKNSHDHPMFGGSLVWFYRYLGGRLSMDITVPEGCGATLEWPVEGVTFSGNGIKAQGTAELVSGTYRLTSGI